MRSKRPADQGGLMKKKGKGKFPLKDLEPKSEEKVKGGGMVSSSVSSITTSTGPGSTTGTGGGPGFTSKSHI